jgi:hypothetical protein
LKPILNGGFHDIAKEPVSKFRKCLLTVHLERDMWPMSNSCRFKNVAVGVLAEQCNINPQLPSTAIIKIYQYQSDVAKEGARLGLIDTFFYPSDSVGW